jgi:TRAP transporter TAXI family solute receptor
MKRKMLLIRMVIIVCVSSVFILSVMAQDEGIGMVTGSTTGTYFRFGNDIAQKAKEVGLNILVKESQGSIDNIKRLSSKENAAFAIVQSDVLGFLKRNPEMADVASRLRLIFPFYKEEVHLLANKSIQRFPDLQGKRVVLGAEGSGNWLTATNLLYMMGITPGQKMYLPPPDAVKAVLKGEADAMFYVAGKPVQLFLNLNDVKAEFPELIDNVHFVPLDDPKMLQEYVSSEINSSDYAWFGATIPTIAVKAVLISFDFASRNTDYYRLRCQQLAQLGKVLRDNINALKQDPNAHPKWKEVNLEENVGIWQLDSCSRRQSSTTVDNDLDKLLKKRW